MKLPRAGLCPEQVSNQNFLEIALTLSLGLNEGILFFNLLPLGCNLTFSTMLYFRLAVGSHQQIVNSQQKGAI